MGNEKEEVEEIEKVKSNLCKKCWKRPTTTTGNPNLCWLCTGIEIVKKEQLARKLSANGKSALS